MLANGGPRPVSCFTPMNAEDCVETYVLEVHMPQDRRLLQVVEGDPRRQPTVELRGAEAVAEPAQVLAQLGVPQPGESHPDAVAERQHAAAPAERPVVI